MADLQMAVSVCRKISHRQEFTVSFLFQYDRLDRPATQVEWKWARTGIPLSYTNWADDIESDYLLGGDCLQMWRNAGLDWDDVDCNDGGSENKPICQKFF